MDSDTCRSSDRRRFLAPIVGLVICLVAALLSIQRTEKQLAHYAGLFLQQQLGLAVQIGAVRATFGALLAVRDIRIGHVARIERAEVQLAPLSVRLIRPALRLQLNAAQDSARGVPRQQALGADLVGRRALPRLGSLTELKQRIRVVDGRMTAELTHESNKVLLTSSGINYDPRSGRALRLVLGPTQVVYAQLLRLRWPAAALEMVLGKNDRLTLQRAAALGGRVVVRDGPAVPLRSVRLNRTSEAYTLRASLDPATPGGRMTLRAHLQPTDRRLQINATLKHAPLNRLLDLFGASAALDGDGTVSGNITVSALARVATVDLALKADLRRLSHPLLASRAIGPLEPSLRGRLIKRRAGVQLADLRLTLDQLSARLWGHFAADETDLRLRMPRTRCQGVLNSLPSNFAPKLAGLKLVGHVGARAKLRLSHAPNGRQRVRFNLNPQSCVVAADPPQADVRRLRGSAEIWVPRPDGSRRRLLLGPGNPNFRRLSSISPHLRAAFVAAEDTYFWTHQGFDARQLRRAFLADLAAGEPIRGASTITQQMIKNALLNHDRTLSRKFQEAVLTWRAEQVLPKSRILELYLNLVELAPGVHGVEGGSQYYFRHDVRRLSPLEAVHLAALAPSPRTFARRFAARPPDQRWMRRLRGLLRLMQRSGAITSEVRERWASRRLRLRVASTREQGRPSLAGL